MSSIHEVAKQAGVSPATVSRTFRTPDLLNHQTRRRVLDVAARLNYVPRPQPSRMETPSAEVTGTLGFLFFVADADASDINAFYAPVLGGAQAEAGLLGLHLIVSTTPRYERAREMPRMFTEEAVDGTLLVGAAPPDVLAPFDTPRRPCVLVDNRDLSGVHDSVLSDSFGGGLAATKYLIGQGHRRIAFVYNESYAPSFQDRRRGYLCALWEAGITPDPDWIVCTNGQEPLEPRLGPLLERGAAHAPTAIFAANDWNALAVLSVCRARGVSVPEDMSVIGFDDIAFSVHSYPPLTTMRVDKEQIGRMAVRRLVARIAERREGHPTAPPLHLVAPVTLIERESCAPLISRQS